MHTHRGSWGALWAWDWCCFNSFNIHNLTETFSNYCSDKSSFDIFPNVSASHVPVQEDQCYQVLQVVLGNPRDLLAQQDPVLLSVHHGPENICDYTTKTPSLHKVASSCAIEEAEL